MSIIRVLALRVPLSTLSLSPLFPSPFPTNKSLIDGTVAIRLDAPSSNHCRRPLQALPSPLIGSTFPSTVASSAGVAVAADWLHVPVNHCWLCRRCRCRWQDTKILAVQKHKQICVKYCLKCFHSKTVTLFIVTQNIVKKIQM